MIVLLDSAHASSDREAFVLRRRHWNDWWRWETLFYLEYIDQNGTSTPVGAVKIAQAGSEVHASPDLPQSFTTLSAEYFSVGQDASYYETLMSLPGDAGKFLLWAINDIAFRPEMYEKHFSTPVMHESLLRDVSASSVEEQFRRILGGGDRKQDFDCSYTESLSPEQALPVELNFVVSAGSLPPSNIHVLIGRNGSGKTRLLRRMAEALIEDDEESSKRFTSRSGRSDRAGLAGVGYFSFSAFDRMPILKSSSPGFTVFDVGLKKDMSRPAKMQEQESVGLKDNTILKSYHDIEKDLGNALFICETKSIQRWKDAVGLLESDPIFRAIDASTLATDVSEKGLTPEAATKFRGLSSGHQVVLLIITELVARLEERTLVLFDEPEGHLHPPLLSALIRAISRLLTEMNAFAIVATHSPVILQEVPVDCVHLVRRTGAGVSIGRPDVETFGENVGVLTREVFGLEVEASGFHELVSSRVLSGANSFQEANEMFGNHLGGEALAIVLATLGARGISSHESLEF